MPSKHRTKTKSVRSAGRKLMKAVKNGNIPTLMKILNDPTTYGVDINYQDKSSEYCDTPLIVAADIGNVETIKFLLQYRTGGPSSKNPNMINTLEQRDSLGSTALFCSKNAQVAKLLLEAGADAYATNLQLSTPLHIHAWHGRDDVVKVLCEEICKTGPNSNAINANNKYLRTPLHRAAEIQEPYLFEKKEKTCRLLIRYGADLHLEDEEFNNPDTLARDTGYDELADNMGLWHSQAKAHGGRGARESCTDSCTIM